MLKMVRLKLIAIVLLVNLIIICAESDGDGDDEDSEPENLNARQRKRRHRHIFQKKTEHEQSEAYSTTDMSSVRTVPEWERSDNSRSPSKHMSPRHKRKDDNGDENKPRDPFADDEYPLTDSESDFSSNSLEQRQPKSEVNPNSRTYQDNRSEYESYASSTDLNPEEDDRKVPKKIVKYHEKPARDVNKSDMSTTMDVQNSIEPDKPAAMINDAQTAVRDRQLSKYDETATEDEYVAAAGGKPDTDVTIEYTKPKYSSKYGVFDYVGGVVTNMRESFSK